MISEVWLECECGDQEEVPEDRINEAFEKLGRKDHSWRIHQTTTTKS